MMPTLKPDTLNGQKILRPVITGGDSIPKLASSSVWHPPTLTVSHAYIPVGRLVEDEVRDIQAMKALKTSELRDRLFNFARRIIENERRRSG